MVTSSPGLIAGSYVLHRLLTPRHPSHALDDLIASTECRPQPIARLVQVRIRSWPHLHGGASGRQCLSCSTCSRLRCSFLGAITHCASDQLGTTGNPAVPTSRQCAASRHFARCLHLSKILPRVARLWRGAVRRGKDSDFENPVNALVRLRSKNPWVGQSCVPGGKLHQVMRHNIAHAVEHAHSQWVFGRFIHIRPSSPGGRAVLVGKKQTRVPKGTLMALASRGEKPEARGFRVVGPAQDPGNSVRPIRLPITRLTACAARTGSGGTLR